MLPLTVGVVAPEHVPVKLVGVLTFEHRLSVKVIRSKSTVVEGLLTVST